MKEPEVVKVAWKPSRLKKCKLGNGASKILLCVKDGAVGSPIYREHHSATKTHKGNISIASQPDSDEPNQSPDD